jgi:hypothetical protein
VYIGIPPVDLVGTLPGFTGGYSAGYSPVRILPGTPVPPVEVYALPGFTSVYSAGYCGCASTQSAAPPVTFG